MAGSGSTLTSFYRFTGTLQVLALDPSSVQADGKNVQQYNHSARRRSRGWRGRHGGEPRLEKSVGDGVIHELWALPGFERLLQLHGLTAFRRPVAEKNWREAVKD
jgi:hypothetical protein